MVAHEPAAKNFSQSVVIKRTHVPFSLRKPLIKFNALIIPFLLIKDSSTVENSFSGVELRNSWRTESWCETWNYVLNCGRRSIADIRSSVDNVLKVNVFMLKRKYVDFPQ